MTTIVVKGPFAPDEVRRIVSLLQDIESMRPAETFEMYLNDPSAIDEALAQRMIEAMHPPPLPGYERTERRWQKDSRSENEHPVAEADMPDDKEVEQGAWVTCEECGFVSDLAVNMVRQSDGAWLCGSCARDKDDEYDDWLRNARG